MEARAADRMFFYSLDGIRAVAAFMVVLLHTAPLFGIERPQESYLAVDLFFALSGVVICHTYEKRLLNGVTLGRFAWIRAVRLYPLYAAGTALSVVGALIFGMEQGSPSLDVLLPLSVAVLPYLGALAGAYFPLNIPAWSLILEFVVNLLYAGIIRRLDRRMLLLIMTISLLGLLFCVRVIRPHSVELGWRNISWRGVDLGLVGGVFRVGYSFFAGVLLYRHFAANRTPGDTARVVAWVPWAIVAAVAVLLSARPSRDLRPFFDLLVVVAVFPALVYWALRFRSAGRADRLFKTAGNLSYAVYAIHYPLSLLMAKAVERFTGARLESFAPWGGIGFLLALLLICTLLDRVYDNPVRSALLKWRAQAAPA